MKITNGDEIMIEFHSPEIDSTGWVEYYSLSLSGVDMTSSIRVCNPPYGESPSDFFSMLANNWKGWVGEKNWASLEGEYSLSASVDRTGHITLITKVFSGSHVPFWSSEVALTIEAGLLESIANGFKDFLHTNS